MSMRASEIIAALSAAIQSHGDLPCYTTDSDIDRLKIHPTVDGAECFENGKRVSKPTEFTIEIVAK